VDIGPGHSLDGGIQPVECLLGDQGGEVRADPAEAVFGGPDGLLVIPAVIARAGELLRSGGMLALEHDETHAAAVPALLEADGRWTAISGCRDLTGRPRFSVANKR
jgi:release factor glutamine methyltransferase